MFQVSPLEMVQEVTHLLIDREETCHRTCFSLQFDGVTLDSFSELRSIEGLKEGSIIKVVEEPYTLRESRIHVRHVRDLLKSVDVTDAYTGVECSALSFMTVLTQNVDNAKVKLGRSASPRPSVPEFSPPEYVIPSAVNGGDQSNAEASSVLKNVPLCPLNPHSKEQLRSPQALKVLATSGWNPPPGSRKLRGDLMYLFLVTVEEKRLHITASTRGFYVNQSTEDVFNPKPANSKVVFHSLVDLLMNVSSGFKRSYAAIQRRRQLMHPFERLATPYQQYTWTSPQLEHTIDSIRAEDAFSSKLGYEEVMPGQVRDWNEELQTTRELPRKLESEKIIRDRAIFKVHSDFIAAATRGAQAVVDGNVLALNPSEETKMQMFIWNNIFLSLGFDVRDHYKDFGGDAAAFVAPCNDLHGVRAFNSLDIEGLYTLATAVIDYKGYRVTAQSIIPGILERDQEQSVVYGSVDFGKTVRSSPKYLELLNQAGEGLKIAPHKVISKDGDEVEIFSSVECKGIIGNDGRHYILDLLRTFPTDPNYIVTADELSEVMRKIGYPRRHKHKLCTLRQELIENFYESRYVLFLKIVSEHIQRKLAEQGPLDEKTLEPLLPERSELIRLTLDNPDKCPVTYKQMMESIASLAMYNVIERKTQIDLFTRIASVVQSDISEAIPNPVDSASSFEIIMDVVKQVVSLDDLKGAIRFNPDIYSPGVTHANENSEDFQKQKRMVKAAGEFLVLVQIPSLASS